MDTPDFATWKKDRLVAYLKERDVNVSRHNKPKLVELAQKVRELTLPLLDVNSAGEEKKRFWCVNDKQLQRKDDFVDNLRNLPCLSLAEETHF